MDFAEQLRILQAARGHQALLALATVDLAHHALPETERARVKDALVAAAVPHWCNRDFLAALLGATPEESDALLTRLRALSIVEPFSARGEHSINVHEASRLVLREHLRTTDPPRWRALSERARAHVAHSPEPHARIEALYHLFATDQPAAATMSAALERETASGWHPEVLSTMALAVGELSKAGWLTGEAQVEALLVPLTVRRARREAAQFEATARQVVNLAREASYWPGLVRAQCLLGDSLLAKGRHEDALALFHDDVTICQRCSAAAPSDVAWLHELAIAHSRVADVWELLDRPDDALAAFTWCLEICQRIAEADPSNAGWRRDLGVAHSRIGGLLQKLGKLDDALAKANEGLIIARQLAATDPSSAAWQGDLATMHWFVAGIHQAQGRLDDALAAGREALAICEALAEKDASNAGWQRDLANAHSGIGTVHLEQGRFDDALAAFRTEVGIFHRIADSDPSNAEWQRNLALAHARVGDASLSCGRFDDGLAAFLRSLDLSLDLATANPVDAVWLRDVALAQCRVGLALRRLAREPEAQARFRESVTTMERAMTMSPGNSTWEQDLASLKTWLA